jgi:uncharacterized membrane protein YbhN (UPF0104 family)
MKHLIHKNHYPHLKKRAFLEFIGLGILVAFLVFQRDVMRESFATVLEVEVLFFVLLMSSYWLLLPLTAISYKFISPKPDKLVLKTTILAHVAGAGPGRIIPGGLGNISISALHLKKTGLSIEQALGVVITNNLFGLIANIILVIGVISVRPETISIISDNISGQHVLIATGIIAALIVVSQWLLHIKGTRKEIKKTFKQWKKIVRQFIIHPRRVMKVLIIAMIISLIQTFMLDLSAYALNVPLAITDALIALSFGVLIGGIIPTPGGVGGVETGITAALIVLGYDAGIAASIAVLFRVATYWQPLIPGTLSYLYLRERKLL